MDGTIRCVVFCVALSLRTCFQLCPRGSLGQGFMVFYAEKVPLLVIDHVLSIHSSVDGHLSCFHFLADIYLHKTANHIPTFTPLLPPREGR